MMTGIDEIGFAMGLCSTSQIITAVKRSEA
jgi:hypothetical protein